MKKIIILTLIMLVGAGAGLFFISTKQSEGQNQNIENPSGININQKAIDFTIQDIETKKEIKLSDFQGKYVFVGFMATWCAPCQIEASNVKRVQEENQFVVIQIGIDPRESEEDLIKFKKEFGRDNWIMAFDKNLEIAQKYKVKSFDTTLVINPEGEIVYRDDGWPVDVKTLKDALRK